MDTAPLISPRRLSAAVAFLACGQHTTYDRRKLGAHGFGVTPKWTAPCAAWLQEHLGLASSR